MTNYQITVDDSFWVRMFQVLHPGMCAMALMCGAPVHRSLAAMLDERRAAAAGRSR